MSGTPARHQWLQSLPPMELLRPYRDGWPSFLSCDNVVISSRETLVDILLRTDFTTAASGGSPAEYAVPSRGRVSPIQLLLDAFQSLPLYTKIMETKNKNRNRNSQFTEESSITCNGLEIFLEKTLWVWKKVKYVSQPSLTKCSILV